MSNNANNMSTIGEISENEFKTLEEGVYSGVLAAITQREFTKFQSTEKEDRITLTFQIVDEDEEGKTQIHYVRSKPFRLVNNEKSTMVALLSSWLKTDQNGLVGLNLGTLLGKVAQCVIKHEQKDNKTYLRLDSLLAPKKSDGTKLVTDAIPAFIVSNAKNYVLADSLTVRKEQKADEGAPIEQAVVDNDEDNLPF